jgi:hypothetical protein
MGTIFCYPKADKVEEPKSDGRSLLIEDDSKPPSSSQQEKKPIVVVIKNAQDLLHHHGIEYRFVACQRHSSYGDTIYNQDNSSTARRIACEECTTRLFHCNDPITVENRKQYISDGHLFDQVSDVCQEKVQERLVNDHRLKFVTLHQDNDDETSKSKRRIIQALVNENYDDDEMDNPVVEDDDRPTLIIMTGKGKSRAGILSVKHLLISGMEVGSASYHIDQALSRNWHVVCLDPNAWGTHHGMEVLEKSLDQLLLLDNDGGAARKTGPVAILAHSAAGGYLVRYLLSGTLHLELFQRLQCIAFTDSTHRVAWARNDPQLYQFLQSKKCLYIRNNSLGSEFPHVAHKQPKAGDDCKVDTWWRARFGSLRTVWAGTSDHSLVCWMARNVVWEFFNANNNASDTMNFYEESYEA